MPLQRRHNRTLGGFDRPEDELLSAGGAGLIDPWMNGGPVMDDPGVSAMPPVGLLGGGPPIGTLPPVQGETPALAGLGGAGGVSPWMNGGPVSLPPSQQGLGTIGGMGAGPATQMATPGRRSMPAQSRAMTTRASRRPGRAVY